MFEAETAPFVKTREAARAVGLSPYFLYRHADHLPAAHRAGRALRWDVPSLKAWMREQATSKGNREANPEIDTSPDCEENYVALATP